MTKLGSSLCTRPGPRFTNGFSIAIQIRWKFRFTLTSTPLPWSLQTLYMARQLCCRGMSKNLLRSDGQQRSHGKAKFPLHLNCGQKNISETGPRRRLKYTYELLNLRVLKFSYVNKIHIFQCMGKIFSVESIPLWKGTFEIPHKISSPYIERYILMLCHLTSCVVKFINDESSLV